MKPTEKKQILVLANSSKRLGRCVAGIEILSRDGERFEFGKFIRPIDATQNEGALRHYTTTIDGRGVKPLDVVEMDLRKHAEDPNHPEDWIIYQGSHWKLLDSLSSKVLEAVPQSEGDAWGKTKGIEPASMPATIQVIKTAKPLQVRAF